jgi:hypothetical protein
MKRDQYVETDEWRWRHSRELRQSWSQIKLEHPVTDEQVYDQHMQTDAGEQKQEKRTNRNREPSGCEASAVVA